MTEGTDLISKCESYLKTLCVDIAQRSVGSEGNREATRFFNAELKANGWKTVMPEFDAMDWIDGDASLKSDDSSFDVLVSPYSLGCNAEAKLVASNTIEKLQSTDCTGKFLFLYGDIAKEQLMPKNFVFYNPEEHQRIIALLEEKKPLAIISATSRNAALAGGVYPFPLIEDGDFDIPSIYMTQEEGEKLKAYENKILILQSKSERIAAKGYNVVGSKGVENSDRIVITAHIDAKKYTPGAIDNGTGVAMMLLISELLKDYNGTKEIEIVALNGEDYYAVPGQMNYISQNQGKFETILLNVNIDGAGYHSGESTFSLFGLPSDLHQKALKTIDESPGIVEGIQWPQGDHSIFVQYGRPAIAVSSKWFIENIDTQDITHTHRDNLDIVECNKVVETAQALSALILAIG